MLKKPNENIKNNAKDFSKDNQIGRKFSKIFKILTNTNYYEGTQYGEFFNGTNNDDQSEIYVRDPLEKELEKVVNSEINEFKYLVGLTGMGKTTLLKNYFRVYDRDIKISGNKVIFYISFYYSNLLSETPSQSINQEIVKYFLRAIKVVLSYSADLVSNEMEFWNGFYDFIIKNKPTMLENEDIIPGISLENEILNNIAFETKIKKLTTACNHDALEYYSCLLKYILTIKGSHYNIILIYDDIESKEEKFHKAVIETARHLHSCFTAVANNKNIVKTIISLRAYTFRCNIGRQLEARREYIQNDVILKKQTVGLHDIFEKRFLAIEKRLMKEHAIDSFNKTSYDDAKQQFQMVERLLDKTASNMIYDLSNYNLTIALVTYCNLLINLEWIPCNEVENNGAFRIDAANYRINTENVIRAIANANSKDYVNNNNIPNILCNDVDGTTLITLYVIKYLLIDDIDEVYGEKYILGKDLLSNIKNLFVNSLDSIQRVEFYERKIDAAIKFLYNTGVLFRSLYDIEDANENQIERKYKDDFKLYLSPKGKCLYNLLSKNAVLLELYRDDIYTDLPNNDKLTSQLNTSDVFIYLLEYIDECFRVETQNIGGIIPNLKKYQEIVGNEFITSLLLEGVMRNIVAYFQNEDDLYTKLVDHVKGICDKMLDYIENIDKSYNIKFSISSYLKREFNYSNP